MVRFVAAKVDDMGNITPFASLASFFGMNQLRFTLLFLLNTWISGHWALTQTPLFIPYANIEKVVDGDLSDWDGNDIAAFTLENTLLRDTAFDNHVGISLEWDAQNLYGLVRVSDRHLIKLRYGRDNPTLNLGDALEIYIDPLFDSRKHMDVNDYQFILDVGGDCAVFKGDRHLVDSAWLAPKELGTATVAFQYQSAYAGTLNREGDRDSMWWVEFALPWAALGKTARAESLFRLDICLNDMDSLIDLNPIREGDPIPPFSYGSWLGFNDFGFPDRWRVCQLKGGPGFWTRLERHYAAYWIPALLVTLLSFLLVVWMLQRKIARLRQVPIRAEMGETALVQLLQPEQIQVGHAPNEALFERLRAFTVSQLHRDIKPEDLARQAHMSLRQLQRIFREELDTTPNTFILLLKMERAAALLRSRMANVSEVAYEVGFSDPGYFSKVFRKYFGVTPSEYAQQ